MVVFFNAAASEYVVKRPDGTFGSYNLADFVYSELASYRDSPECPPDETVVVPVFCERERCCRFGATRAFPPSPSRWVRDRIGDGALKIVVGVACVFDKSYARPEPGSGAPSAEDDLDEAAHFAKYHEAASGYEASTFQHVAQPGVPGGDFRYGHRVSIGRVVAYWHVHRGDKTYLVAAAAVTDPDAVRLAEQYISDRGSTVALSLSSYDMGHQECVAELSIVLVPARRGCFGKIVPVERLEETLAEMCFGANVGCKVEAAFFAGIEGGSGSESESKRLALLRTTADMLATHRDVLKITKTHAGTNLEKYINRGVDDYLQLNRGISAPKLLTAGLGLSPSIAAMDESPELKNLVYHFGLKHLVEKESGGGGSIAAAVSSKRRSRAPPAEDHSDDDSEYEEFRRAKRQRKRAEEKAARDEKTKLFAEFTKFLAQNATAAVASAPTPTPAPTPAPTDHLADVMTAFKTQCEQMRASIEKMASTMAQAQAKVPPTEVPAPAPTPVPAPAEVETRAASEPKKTENKVEAGFQSRGVGAPGAKTKKSVTGLFSSLDVMG